MINIKSADLTNSSQKFIAGLAITLVLVILYFLLPPLVSILANLWLVAILGIPLLFLIYNYQMIWEVFKRMSWEMTKKLISSNKLWYMYRYHDYMLRKIGELGDNVKNVGAIKSSTERSVNDKIKELKRSKEEAISLQERKAANTVIKIVQSKVALLQQQIDSFLPRLDYIKNQEKSLIELYDIWKADTEILKNTLDAKAEEYEMMKQLSSASDSAMAFLKKDSPELRDYNLSLKMIEQSVNEYTSNVENFQREVAPTIVRLSAQSDANADEGAKLIEEYKQARIKL